MKRLGIMLAAALIFSASAVNAQRSGDEIEAVEEGDLEASAAAAEAGDEAEREEQENRRRRAMPQETKIDLGDERSIRVTAMAWPLDGPDYPRLADLGAGEVMDIKASAPPKLWTHVNLTFGDLTIKTENVADNYPGVYGLWLRKTENGWSLVFNNKADVWGTMHDPAADAGQVTLQHAVTDSTGEAFATRLEETSEGVGILHVTWGEHHWSTPFTYGG